MLRPRPHPRPSETPVSPSNSASSTAMHTRDNLTTPLLKRKPPQQSHHSLNSSSPPLPQFDGVEQRDMDLSSLSRKSQWIILAIASGACAAFNGVFAKLTTTELTTSFAVAISRFLGLGDGAKVVEAVIRAMFFGMNLIFNGIMWTLFTKALARGSSTTQVSIINTSSNFMMTAILGFFIFTESLPPLWWLGATLLVAGNVIIGRREERDADGTVDPTEGLHVAAENGQGVYTEEEDGLLRESVELADELEGALKRGQEQEEDDILDLEVSGDEVMR